MAETSTTSTMECTDEPGRGAKEEFLDIVIVPAGLLVDQIEDDSVQLIVRLDEVGEGD